MSTTEETKLHDEEARIQRSYEFGRTKWDAIRSIYKSNPLRLVLAIIGIIVLNILLDGVLNLAVVFLGFLLFGLASWVLFPHANWVWTLKFDLKRRIVTPGQIKVEDAKAIMDNPVVKRNFDDGQGRNVIVLGKTLPVGEVHLIAEMEYLADVTILSLAIEALEPLVTEHAILRRHRGLDVGRVAARAIELQNRVKDPLSSSELLELLSRLKSDERERPEESIDS